MRDLHLVIVTGLSGAGKSQAIHAMEDLNFFCIDNLPPAMLHQFALLLHHSATEETMQRVAVCIDVRSGVFFNDFIASLDQLDKEEIRYEILYLEASDETLIRRFKEVRRPHPLSPQGRIGEGIHNERERLEPLKRLATRIVDTTHLNVHQLKAQMRDLYAPVYGGEGISINILSFGFKYGLPEDADLLFDVRFLPNPHWDPQLRPLTGEDESVYDYVINNEVTKTFLKMQEEMLAFLLPNFVKEGKNQLVIAIGCTGGRHRSVACSMHLAQFLQGKAGMVHLVHRDIDALEYEDRNI